MSGTTCSASVAPSRWAPGFGGTSEADDRVPTSYGSRLLAILTGLGRNAGLTCAQGHARTYEPDHYNKVRDYSLEDITVSAEVSATGRLSIQGTGREIGGNGGFSFTFKKRA
jgi:hypothetical protein